MNKLMDVTITDHFNTKSGNFQYYSSADQGKINTDPNNSNNIIACKSTIIEFPGLGKLVVGNEPDRPHHALHGEVNIVLEPHIHAADAGEALQKMFALLEIQGVVSDAGPVDTERMKMMAMFQILYPDKVAELMKSNPLELSPAKLKKEMMEVVPELEDNFDEKLGNMYLQEVRPGQKEWALNGH
jgi:hypothetical protein